MGKQKGATTSTKYSERYAFGRYPLMVLVAYSTMKAFGEEAVNGPGFDESEEAIRTLAVAIATAYAMRKQSWVGRYSTKPDARRQTWYEVEAKIEKDYGDPSAMYVNCLGETFYVRKVLGGYEVVGWHASRKWRPLNGRKFNSVLSTLERLGIDFEALTKRMQEELKTLFKKSPASSQTYFRVWKEVRDVWRTWDWLKGE